MFTEILGLLIFASPLYSIPIEDVTPIDELVFKQPSDVTGDRLAKWNETDEINPEEIGEYFEGDILYPASLRNGLINPLSRWDNAIIPYDYSGVFIQKDVDLIESAMEEFRKFTCITFKKRTKEEDFLIITNTKTGCWSSVGKIGGKQELNLQSPGCLTKIGTPIHELMHAAGFTHEQNRWERDDFVDIYWSNIQTGKENNFRKSTQELTDGFDVPYDFNSVLHYSEKAFSNNGNPTIVSKVGDVKMGQRDGFSKGDVKKLRSMYNCPKDSQGNKGNNNNNNQNGNGGIFNPGGILSLIFG